MKHILLSIVLCASLAVAATCVAAEVNDGQDEAVSQIAKLGGKVQIDQEATGKPVVSVDFGCPITNDTNYSMHLWQHPYSLIWYLGPPLPKITDSGLEYVTEFTHLRTVVLRGCGGITDAGVEHFKGLKQLRTLDLGFTGITDAGIEHLKGLTQLYTLNLSHTWVGDAGLEHLKGLTELRTLILEWDGGHWITDAGLAHLKGLTQLQTLHLINCRDLTDKGLESLKGFGHLQTLDLSSCDGITDARIGTRQGAHAASKRESVLVQCDRGCWHGAPQRAHSTPDAETEVYTHYGCWHGAPQRAHSTPDARCEPNGGRRCRPGAPQRACSATDTNPGTHRWPSDY